MPSLDYSDVASPLEEAASTTTIDSSTTIKEVKRSPSKVRVFGMRSTPNKEVAPTLKQSTIEEFLEISDGLE